MTANGLCPPHFFPSKADGNNSEVVQIELHPFENEVYNGASRTGIRFLAKEQREQASEKTENTNWADSGEWQNTKHDSGEWQNTSRADTGQECFSSICIFAADAYYWLVTTFLSHVTKYSTRLT